MNIPSTVGGGGGHGGGVLGNDLISLKIPIGIPVIAWWGFQEDVLAFSQNNWNDPQQCNTHLCVCNTTQYDRVKTDDDDDVIHGQPS